MQKLYIHTHQCIGMAQGTIVIPTTKDKAEHVVQQVEDRLAQELGGYSSYNGVGGWINVDSRITENHVRIISSHENRELVRREMVGLAEFVKDKLDEDAVMVEVVESEVTMV